jgi:hypothetical protein
MPVYIEDHFTYIITTRSSKKCGKSLQIGQRRKKFMVSTETLCVNGCGTRLLCSTIALRDSTTTFLGSLVLAK